ncbi:PREDICTED: molybdenum cofactor sulfurase-like isoform X2 [Priapulus caudatus]|uniref:Molybdenum cofactor sulfurase n=1 Tax=Priapulus caudatus TaxID=37621 RepID=A0ABM1EEZ3_PRICU|nr:PREDICTED: molybdenum cofactor sulfurase-like isoform X2 [Priapulus caudatus]
MEQLAGTVNMLRHHSDSLQALRVLEFGRLQKGIYLDHAAAALYTKSQINATHMDLLSNHYGNPHSRHSSSQLATEMIERTRLRVLKFFCTSSDDYSVVFTAGCTAALKLVADSFRWTDGTTGRAPGVFCYLNDSHTSVLGMREVAAQRGASVNCVSISDVERLTADLQWRDGVSTLRHQRACKSLFAMPAQCNFSGRKYPLSWVAAVHGGALDDRRPMQQSENETQETTAPPVAGSNTYVDGTAWYVLLDASALVGTAPLDLGEHRPDYVAVSFYKMFGYPTGVGALLVRNDSQGALARTYFGGGTVQVSLASERYHTCRLGISERFEDGTIPFLEIAALRHGFDVLEGMAGGIHHISSYAFSLARYVYERLDALCHHNGAPVARIYCDTRYDNVATQGAILAFNILKETGEYEGYAEVEKMASLYNIQLRTGCFCNPGACQRHLGLTNEQVKQHFQAGHMCGDSVDVISGCPTGAVRISFGWMSTLEDGQRFLDMVRTCFVVAHSTGEMHCDKSGTNVDNPCVLRPVSPFSDSAVVADCHGVMSAKTADTSHISAPDMQENESLRLSRIFLYPVKSCGSLEVHEWKLSERGLLYDRQWMVVTDAGIVLTQKRESRLCLIKPRLDLLAGVLWLTFPDTNPLSVPLAMDHDKQEQATSAERFTGTVCRARVWGQDCGAEAGRWLSACLNRPGCRLVAHDPGSKRTPDDARPDPDDLMERFRANLVIAGGTPFEEERWESVQIGCHSFQSLGHCTRCAVICTNQRTAEFGRQLLVTLRSLRAGKLNFGIYVRASYSSSDATSTLRVGDQVLPAYRLVVEA